MAVSDHTTASRGSQVYQLTNGHLRLMHADPDIIPIDPEVRGKQTS
jgi:hypothetical protein